MRLTPEKHTPGKSLHGQTGLLVTLFLCIIGLTGFCTYTFIQQGISTEELTKKIEKQEKDLRTAKATIEELTEKIRTQKDSISEQIDMISRLKNETTAAKDAVAQIQSSLNNNLASVQKNLDTIKADSNQRLGSFLESSSKMESKLNELVDQIKKMQQPATTPVVDVKMEPAPKQ